VPTASSTNATYKSTANSTFTFYNQFLTQSAAERTCQDAGGHLAAFNTLAEQKQVEAYYIAQGLLLTDYHKHYWMGLTSSRSTWTWMDKAVSGAPAGGPDRRLLHRWQHSLVLPASCALLTPCLRALMHAAHRPQLQPVGRWAAGRRHQHHLCCCPRLNAQERRLGLGRPALREHPVSLHLPEAG
jgi:hypothetical protein